ncbi:hypothetical protein [Halobiforma nitratireducens]|uniref:Uncharacterized protein n=1 Tax=Halobiforma nitratireducens JCM 10879 TaxID=1227454 RepID=M0M633_9EURY|nr:hypothetical protein [Halobiforma nitratireducens]EMA41156.1 hypothetical protein C446_06350 [Halobiforma nitratireducens JCM 10879]
MALPCFDVALSDRQRPRLRVLEVAAAVLFPLLWASIFAPALESLFAPLESFVVSPLLASAVVPGLLCLVALAGAVADGLGIDTAVVGVLVAVTSLLIAWDVPVVLFHTGGGVHVAPLFVFVSGTVLAVVVIRRALLATVAPGGVVGWIRGRRSES